MPKMSFFYRPLLVLLALLTTLSATAQTDHPEMADLMRADGKIWVVVAMLAVIFAGIFAYLIRLEIKIRRLERDVK